MKKNRKKKNRKKRETVKEMSANTGDKEIHDIDRLDSGIVARGILEVMPDGFGLSEVIIIFQEIMISIFRRLRSVDSI